MVTNMGMDFSTSPGAIRSRFSTSISLVKRAEGFRTIAVRIPYLLFCSDENLVAINPDFVSGFRVSSRTLYNSARPQIEPGTVPWALHLIVLESPLIEGSFLMSTDISNGVVFSVNICKYHVLAIYSDLSHYAGRNLGR